MRKDCRIKCWFFAFSVLVLLHATDGFDPFMDNELHKIEWVDQKSTDNPEKSVHLI